MELGLFQWVNGMLLSRPSSRESKLMSLSLSPGDLGSIFLLPQKSQPLFPVCFPTYNNDGVVL